MSLTDLKKKTDLKKRRKLSVDEFIEDANAYAQGSKVVETTEHPHYKHRRNFKPSTFTLSPESIEQLNELTRKTGIAKSRLIRLMIDRMYHEELNSEIDIEI